LQRRRDQFVLAVAIRDEGVVERQGALADGRSEVRARSCR
jgi:hypothetical protein